MESDLYFTSFEDRKKIFWIKKNKRKDAKTKEALRTKENY